MAGAIGFGVIRAGVCRTVWLAALALVGLMAAGGCGGESPREPGPVRVVVSVPPLESLVRGLLPADADVRVLVGPGQSPHGFEPTPSDMAAVGRADLVVLVGLGMESFLPASVREGKRVFEVAGALGIEGGAHHHHSHAGHDHSNCGTENDPHLWLDPVLMGELVPVLSSGMRGALERAGQGAEGLSEREASLRSMVERVHGAYETALASRAGAAIVTQHAGWSRLAERYGIEVVGVIQPDGHGEPSPVQIAGVISSAQVGQAVAVFGEAQLDARLAERVAEQLELPVGSLDPLGDGDWRAMMLGNLEALVAAIPADAPVESGGAEPAG